MQPQSVESAAKIRPRAEAQGRATYIKPRKVPKSTAPKLLSSLGISAASAAKGSAVAFIAAAGTDMAALDWAGLEDTAGRGWEHRAVLR